MDRFQFIYEAFAVGVRASVLVQPELVALGWGQTVVLSSLPFATNLMYDLRQVIYLLWASVASSVK